MAEGIPARLTPREGRKFGLTVGLAFLVIGAVFYWRGATTMPYVFGGIGAALAAAGLVVPGHLGPVYRAWMRFALLLSKVTTPIFMGLMYFVVIMPIGFLRRLFGGNPLRAKSANEGVWVTRATERTTAGGMTRQF